MPRKKKIQRPKREMITEYEGWKAGDICHVVFSGESRAVKCEVLEFHLKDDISICASVRDIVSGMYRVSPLECMSDNSKEAKSARAKWDKWYKKYMESKNHS